MIPGGPVTGEGAPGGSISGTAEGAGVIDIDLHDWADENIKPALARSFQISLRSILSVSNTKEVGNKYREATKYNSLCSPSITPSELNIEGIK